MTILNGCLEIVSVVSVKERGLNLCLTGMFSSSRGVVQDGFTYSFGRAIPFVRQAFLSAAFRRPLSHHCIHGSTAVLGVVFFPFQNPFFLS